MYVNISTIKKVFASLSTNYVFYVKKTMENTDNIIEKNDYVKILYFL